MCVPDASSDGPSVIAIRNGVAARPSPGLELVGGYLQVRLGEHAALAITSAIQGDRGRTTRRHLQQLRLAPPHVWQALLPTVLAGVHALRHQCTRAQAAHQLGLRDVTIARHCRALTGRSWRDLLALTSWEAMMEAGVRCGARETVGSIDPDELV
ncbi:MAG TPA: hypothetical protein VFN22_10755 [Gemmatimonadales bacterium]|nr:hypothetical protein [Gemmatimonadales bacterium]